MIKKNIGYIIGLFFAISGSAFSLINNTNILFKTGTDIYTRLTALIAICAILAGAFYMLKGFKKYVASYFKLFIYMYLLAEVVNLGGMCLMESAPPIYYFLPAVISYGFINVLAFARDLGKTKTIIFAGTVMVLQLSMAAVATITQTDLYRGGYLLGNGLFTRSVTNHSLSVVLFVMMFYKYRDKAQRKGEKENAGLTE